LRGAKIAGANYYAKAGTACAAAPFGTTLEAYALGAEVLASEFVEFTSTTTTTP
jgi:hypothetical protein